MSEVVTDSVVMETCCSCSIRFPMFRSFYDHVRRYGGGKDDRGSFWCPKGHRQHYTAEGDHAKAARLAAELAAAKQREETFRHRADQAERKRKAEVTKRKSIEKRIYAGICPCCNRTFQNLMRHMRTKHPETRHEEGVAA